MMKYGWEGAVKTKCPYYLGESKLSIRCECDEEKACQVYKFSSEEDKQDFQRHFCYLPSGWCNHAKRMKKYYDLRISESTDSEQEKRL